MKLRIAEENAERELVEAEELASKLRDTEVKVERERVAAAESEQVAAEVALA